MIPSLSGSIYKFDGESVEPIPITADNLLSSSYKYSDELVISGILITFFSQSSLSTNNNENKKLTIITIY